MAAAERSRVSAARHIFRLQGVYDYAHDAIGGRAGEQLYSTNGWPREKAVTGRYCVESLGIGRIIIGAKMS
jgi:hypothetical protein